MARRLNNHKGERAAYKFSPDAIARASEERSEYRTENAPELILDDESAGVWIYRGDSLVLLERISEKHPHGLFDLIFADPPYFLSDGGITCHAGRMVSVDKGEWDKISSVAEMHSFNRRWLELCQKVLKPDGTIFVSGTAHVIHSVGFAMQELGFKLLNDIIWVKPNPPPNLSCRYFTHCSETILWAAKGMKSKHRFNYQLMKSEANGRQMKSVWKDIQWDETDIQTILEIMPPGPDEKRYGKHPTQKPVALLTRIIQAASEIGDFVLDPFLGSGTTAVAAIRLSRKVVGCELSPEYADLAVKRIRSELEKSRDLPRGGGLQSVRQGPRQLSLYSKPPGRGAK